MTSIADMDADRKIAVLKNAVLALTKQKQAVEASKVSLETKVAGLMEELAKSEERNSLLAAKNKELTAEIERFNSSATRLASMPGAAARSLLGTLSSTINITSPPTTNDRGAANHQLDQQRLFEENEALHIQIFEQRSEYERRIKQLESERTQQALRVHTLEGLVASVQASDVATSQQATEARRELAIERGYTSLCQYMLLRGLVASLSLPTPAEAEFSVLDSTLKNEHHLTAISEADANGVYLKSGDNNTLSLASAASSPTQSRCLEVLCVVTRRCCEVIQHSMSSVSALLPHTVSSSSSSSTSSSGVANSAQSIQRQRTVIAAHRECRNAVNSLCTELLADLSNSGQSDQHQSREADAGEEQTVPEHTATTRETWAHIEKRERAITERLALLLGHVTSWLHMLHNNAGLLLGPLEPLHEARSRAVLAAAAGGKRVGQGEGRTSTSTHHEEKLQTLEQQFQAVVASIIGEIRVLRDCIRLLIRGGAGGSKSANSSSSAKQSSAIDSFQSSRRSVLPFALRLVGAMFAYRNQCAAAPSGSHGGGLSFERLLYNLEAAANFIDPSTRAGSGPSSVALPTHYSVPLQHLISTLKEAGRVWGSAFGSLALFDGRGPQKLGHGIWTDRWDGGEAQDKGALFLPATGIGSAERGQMDGVLVPMQNRGQGSLLKAMTSYFAACAAIENAKETSSVGEKRDGEGPLLSNRAAQAVADDVLHMPSITSFALAAMEAELAAHLRAADANASHCYAISRRAMLELAHCHDRIDQLAARNTAVEGDNERMRKEYVSVVDVYESQIRLLSDHLAELAQDGSVASNGKKR